MPESSPKQHAPRAARLKKARVAKALERSRLIEYRPKQGVVAYARAVVQATPMERVELERHGIPGAVIKEVSKRIGVPAVRVFKILGVPKATVEKKASGGQLLKGSGGLAAVGMIRLLGIAQELVASSTAKGASEFDAAKWLGTWIERPQPALGGRRPSDLLDTPTGVEVVARLLGAIESGAYQ